jgi:hypothetical protein
MPSGEHETPIALAKLDPKLARWLLSHLFDIKVPDYHHSRAQPTDVRVVVPRTYHADGMLLFCDVDDQPLLAVVLEVQRGWDKGKRWTWKLYVAQLEAELRVNTALLVYCPDPAIARRYRRMLESEGLSLPLRPYIFTPDDVPLVLEPELARADPTVAVFSAICHGGDADIDAAFPALAEALQALDPKEAISYYDIVLAGLPPEPRARWEAYMSTAVESKYHSELFRELDAQARAEGKAEGKAEGEVQAVLTVLAARNVPVSDEIREQILACTDLTVLDTWLRRAVTAVAADDVICP